MDLSLPRRGGVREARRDVRDTRRYGWMNEKRKLKTREFQIP
jgi:hypothetical protein